MMKRAVTKGSPPEPVSFEKDFCGNPGRRINGWTGIAIDGALTRGLGGRKVRAPVVASKSGNPSHIPAGKNLRVVSRKEPPSLSK
jgi:hypothetical protein